MTVPFLTAGRQALADRLQADATLSARVRTWRLAQPAPRRGTPLEPSDWPALQMAPATLEPGAAADTVDALPQDVAITLTAGGPDASPCEEMVCAVLDCVTAADSDRLGLADQGLVSVRSRSVRWQHLEPPADTRGAWRAEVLVRLSWLRTIA